MNESAALMSHTLALLRSSALVGVQGIYINRADDKAKMPYVVISHRTSTPWHGIGRDNRQGSDITISVKVIGDGDNYGPLVPVAGRIDALLESHQGAIPATADTPQIEVFGLQKESDTLYTDPSTALGGRQIYHLGGVYRATLGITK